MTQLFSPDEYLPHFTQPVCVKQHGSTDCGLFSIAYAIDLLHGNNPQDYTYDQNKMRQHLITCFETKKMLPFPKFSNNQSNECMSMSTALTKESSWSIPKRRSKRLQAIQQTQAISLQNRFLAPQVVRTQETTKPILQKHQITAVVHNISGIKLHKDELSLLEKGLNFCPSHKSLDTDQLLDDIYFYCRNLRLKEHFFNDDQEESTDVEQSVEERCPMTSTYRNRYFNPSMNSSPNLEKFISNVKSEITDLCAAPIRHKSNMSQLERAKLVSLKERKDIIIQRADKGGKIVLMNPETYERSCIAQLEDESFYMKLDSDPTDTIKKEILSELSNMHNRELIDNKERKLLEEHLIKPRTPFFYGLPKIHKMFSSFPPLRPIISGYNSCTARLSEYLDTFLKYQAKRRKSFLRDTKDFLVKLQSLKGKIPNRSILVTMDVSSLYTNIDHEEGAEACYRALQSRSNKKISSRILKKLILLVLNSNVFRFGNQLYKQVKGTAMGTPMAPNYANLFMADFEELLLKEYRKKTGLAPLVWFRFIDDIFFVWHHEEAALDDFLLFCNDFSKNKSMKSNIQFQTHKSAESVNFLDVTVFLKDGEITTSLYSKPTDAHLYLNAKSCHPPHVIRNIPKGQFIRVRRICSQLEDFVKNGKRLCKHFVDRGYNENFIEKVFQTVKNMDRSTLLNEENNPPNDPQSILVTTWHPHLNKLPSILHKNYNILSQDSQLSKIFTSKPMVAFKRRKTLGNYLVRNDVTKKKTAESTNSNCSCKTCLLIKRDSSTITNPKTGLSLPAIQNVTCKTSGVVYVATCKRHNAVYVGHTSKTIAKRFYGHRYDTKERPDNNELTEHLHHHHDFDSDLMIQIAHADIEDTGYRKFLEDKVMCQLQSRNATGLNSDCGAYAKEMYASWKAVSNHEKRASDNVGLPQI